MKITNYHKNKDTIYDKGLLGEELAANFLCQNGFEIVKKRAKTQFAEIDIIAKKETNLHIIEVKYRKAKISDAIEAINKRKRRNIEQALLKFLGENEEYNEFDIQFDIIVIVKNGNKFKINHIENAWWFGE